MDVHNYERMTTQDDGSPWKQAATDIWMAVRLAAQDPHQSVVSLIRSLEPRRALMAGLTMCLLFGLTAGLCVQHLMDSLGAFGGLMMRPSRTDTLPRWIMIGCLPPLALVGLNMALFRLRKSDYSMGAAALLTGGAFLPLTVALLLTDILFLMSVVNLSLYGLLLAGGLWLTGLAVYGASLRTHSFTPRVAALAVPLALASSFWIAGAVSHLLM